MSPYRQVTDAPRLEGDCIGLEWGDGSGFAQLLYCLQRIYEVLLVYLPLDMQNGCNYSAGGMLFTRWI
jgi:hypothetical protein